MILKMFSTLDDENVINKKIELVHEMDITIKNDVDILNPVLILSDKLGRLDFTSCNYCELPHFNRKYFIRSIVGRGEGIWNVHLECDVLETYKDDILNTVANISRPIKKGEYMSSSSNPDVRKTINIFKSDVQIVRDNNFLFSTIGRA